VDRIRVHQLWLQGRAAIPPDLLRSMGTWVDAVGARPDYDYCLWDDGAIRALLRRIPLPRIRPIYESLPEHLLGIRADIARLVVLFHFGGLYADADTRVLRPELVLDHFARALLVERTAVVIGTADLNGCTRWWIEATRRPSNFLIGCRERSSFIATYLERIADDFEARGLREALALAGRWSRYESRRITKRWTGPKKLRAVLREARRGANHARLTPVGFVACGRQRCFPGAAVAHDYESSWYPRSRFWTAVRGRALHSFLAMPLDGGVMVALLWALVLVAFRR
jgi:hypothetical protein